MFPILNNLFTSFLNLFISLTKLKKIYYKERKKNIFEKGDAKSLFRGPVPTGINTA